MLRFLIKCRYLYRKVLRLINMVSISAQGRFAAFGSISVEMIIEPLPRFLQPLIQDALNLVVPTSVVVINHELAKQYGLITSKNGNDNEF